MTFRSETESAGPRPPQNCTVDQLLAHARALGIDRLDAQLLVGHAVGRTRSWILAHGEDPLPPPQAQACGELLQRRALGWPVAYLIGHREFYGLELRVTPDVLDPRPDTETLVDWALEVLRERPGAPERRPRVLDLGTGSGAIALAVQARFPAAEVHATDASAAALEVARSNAQAHGLNVCFHLGSWWEAVPRGMFDLVLSNPPYIAEDDPHMAQLAWEPRQALTAAQGGMADLRAIVLGAPARLAPGGALLLEHGHDQSAAVGACLSEAGLQGISHRTDLGGHTRCTGGWLAG